MCSVVAGRKWRAEAEKWTHKVVALVVVREDLGDLSLPLEEEDVDNLADGGG